MSCFCFVHEGGGETHMCSVDTWLRPWASWEARFSSRQPSRQVTSSAILPLYRRLLVVVAGRGEGRGSWFNTETRGGNSQRKKKTKPNILESRKTANWAKCQESTSATAQSKWMGQNVWVWQHRKSTWFHSQSVRLAIPARVVMGTWGISPFMLKVRVGECVDTQVDQGVNGRHPSSHLLTPGKEKRGQSS